jgi:unsaturated rhamnogalacturonyl hydrolase
VGLSGQIRMSGRSTMLTLAWVAFAASILHPQMLSPHGIPTYPKISAEEQAGIDDDIAHHLGDVVADPGPKAKLSASLNPAAVHAAMRKVADWELKQAEPYLDPGWTWGVLDTGFMAASSELHDPRYSNAMLAMAEKFHWEMGAVDPKDFGWPDNDDQMIAQTYLELYFLDPQPEKIAPTRKALDGLFGTALPPSSG